MNIKNKKLITEENKMIIINRNYRNTKAKCKNLLRIQN